MVNVYGVIAELVVLPLEIVTERAEAVSVGKMPLVNESIMYPDASDV